MPEIKRTNKLQKIYLFLGVAFIIFAAFKIVQNSSQYHKATAEAITNASSHQPERLTELYFVKPPILPVVYTSNKPINFTFALHNLEQRDMHYGYTVSVGDGLNTQVLVNHTVSVKKAIVQLIPLKLAIPLTSTRVLVSVNITGTNQSIDFWVARKA